MSVLQLLATSILLAIFETIHISPKKRTSFEFFFVSSLFLCFYLLNDKLIYWVLQASLHVLAKINSQKLLNVLTEKKRFVF